MRKLILDTSIGIGSIFREIGEICEITKVNDTSLVKELDECNRKLPELAAKLLMKGASVELMDGDGLSVATGWLEEVMKALRQRIMDILDMKKDPKIFVLTILGTQSTGKSTLLNTMFEVHFPVSAGRCTKGAFIQFIPILLDNVPYDGVIVVDTEGLGVPEFKEDNQHGNEIATFVLGISDLAIINVRGEVPTNIENFLQVSICALIRISLVEFHPSVVFVHQNRDPSAKEKNLEGRHIFMKEIDKTVLTQARLIQKSDQFSCFQDVVDISLEDGKNDFDYFPQLLEGSPPMSPPNGNYSKSCSNLTRYILSKMKINFEKFNNAQSLLEFAEKIKAVWNAVLDENFVLSLINGAEIQVKYDIDDQMSNWKVKMESYMEDILEIFCREIEADFKAKEIIQEFLRTKKELLEVNSHVINNEQMKNFITYIQRQTLHETIYKNWEQKCINKMDKNRGRIVEDCQRRLSDYFNHEKNVAQWRDELEEIKNKLQDHARQIANELVTKKEKKAGENVSPEFSDEEIENEFQTFWTTAIDRFNSKKEKTFAPDDVPNKFYHEIGLRYGNVASFKKISDKFGVNLQNKFKIDWVEFTGNIFSKNYKKCIKNILEAEFSHNMRQLIIKTETKLLYEVIGLCDIGGLMKMHFQPDCAAFDCERLVKIYLTKAKELLEETHSESPQKKVYNLTDTFKLMFLFKGAQLALPNFGKAQQSFIGVKDISTKLDNERENIKQIFTLILKKEGTLIIAAKQVTKRLHNALRNAVLKQISTPCKDILLRLVTQKIHVHGLVLHNVIDMLEDNIRMENVNYLKEYFPDLFHVFRKKILHVFDGCPDIKLNDMIREKFDTATRKLREFIEKELKLSEESSLIQVICQNNYIKSLGVGEKDFGGIAMPQYNKQETLDLAKRYSYSEISKARKEKIKKRIDDETEIIEKLKLLISNTDEVNTDITLHQQSEIKEKIITDVNNHLFQCDKTCPLCHGLCNETHPGGLGSDSKHKSRCHRPKGFSGFTMNESGEFVTSFCNKSVKSNFKFKNPDTNLEKVYFRDYRTVNDYYKSWDIEGMASDDSLYWKYITYQVTKNLNKFFPKAKKPDLSSWEGISKSEAIKTINSLFHLDANTIAKNKDGFHYIKTSQIHS